MYVESLQQNLTRILHKLKKLRAPWRWQTAETETCRSNS